MAKGLPGADSSVKVTTTNGEKTLVQLATEFYGQAPAFWGRYFTAITTGGPVEYRHSQENNILRASGIRVLPLARQTVRVAGTLQDGEADGALNAQDFLVTFGEDYLASQGDTYYMFLDVEGAPDLSTAYFVGWSKALAMASSKVAIRPCVYASLGDSGTWKALIDAKAQFDVACAGVWVARWLSPGGCRALPDWSDEMVTPATSPAFPFPVLAWQYSPSCYGNDGFDCSEVNPNLPDWSANLVLPAQV